MNHQILLVSRDQQLATRVRRALTGAIASDLHCDPRYRPCADRRGWLLILVDAAAGADSGLADSDRVEPSARCGGATGRSAAEFGAEHGLAASPAASAGAMVEAAAAPVPVIWMAEPPLLTSTGNASTPEDSIIVDYINRAEAPSKLAFILHQHLASAYLRRMRFLSPAAMTFTAAERENGELQRQLNNALTGILGNAELAMDTGRRLPANLSQRLVRICELAEQMRDVLVELPAVFPQPKSSA